MQDFTTGELSPFQNVSHLLGAHWSLCLSVVGCLGLQPHLLSSLLLNLRGDWRCVRRKIHTPRGCQVTPWREHAGNERGGGGTPVTVATGGAGGRGRRNEAKNVERGGRLDSYPSIHSFIHSFTSTGAFIHKQVLTTYTLSQGIPFLPSPSPWGPPHLPCSKHLIRPGWGAPRSCPGGARPRSTPAPPFASLAACDLEQVS